MKDDKSKDSDITHDRRSLLKGLVAGSAIVSGSKALPETWSKPLTETIVLPGHAQTTNDFGGGDYGDGARRPGSDLEDKYISHDGEEDFIYGDAEFDTEEEDGDYQENDKYYNYHGIYGDGDTNDTVI